MVGSEDYNPEYFGEVADKLEDPLEMRHLPEDGKSGPLEKSSVVERKDPLKQKKLEWGTPTDHLSVVEKRRIGYRRPLRAT
jgi:hypothetical protein